MSQERLLRCTPAHAILQNHSSAGWGGPLLTVCSWYPWDGHVSPKTSPTNVQSSSRFSECSGDNQRKNKCQLRRIIRGNVTGPARPSGVVTQYRINLSKVIIQMILNDGISVRKDPGDNSLLLLASMRDPMIDIRVSIPQIRERSTFSH